MLAENPIKKKIRKICQDGTLTCSQAHAIAKEYDLELAELGDILREMDIKITGCQLGAF